jgi:hypothetical protein
MVSSTHLRNQAFEEAGEAFMSRHVGKNLKSALWIFEVTILDSRLDDIERSRHNQRRRGSRNRGDEVLEPGGFVVVLKAEKKLFGKCRAAEELA